MQELKPYDAGLRRRLGRRALPDRPAGAARKRARAQMDDKLLALCAQQVPGDTYRNLNVRTR